MADWADTEITEKLASRSTRARRDIFTGGILLSAALLFIGTGSSVLGAVINTLSGLGGGPDRTLAAALILNIALMLFGWRRYSDLLVEVQERTEAEERARYLAAVDPLTGFLNRRAFMDAGGPALDAAVAQNKSAALFLIDLDRFKNVNDVYGHAAGDLVLQEAARRIAAILPPSAQIARLGGDEFVALICHEQDQDMIERLAGQLVAAMERPISSQGRDVRTGASIGIAGIGAGSSSATSTSHDPLTIETLIRRADIAMYHSKGIGRNRFSWFEPGMESAVQDRNMIETGIREGLPRGEFVPYFEPQVDIATGELKGFEMLTRWHSPQMGLVMPDRFIGVAESSGQIAEMSMVVTRAALEIAKHWNPSLMLAINISPQQLKDPWFSQKLMKLLVETGFPANRLEVEITETSLFENMALVRSIVTSLKNQGVSLSLDDFGTGYSSLSHLRALPFDRIKIDRSFVLAMRDSGDARAIVQAIVRLGESLGMPITAEGVEDEAIARDLAELGCAKAQGWHYGKPASPGETRRMLAARGLIAGGQRSAEAGQDEPAAVRRSA
jgi:diguanylate cyclase (GGDEF)-like protein